MDSSSILVPIFGGQGMTPLGDYKKTTTLAASPSAIVLLEACYAVFHSELASLSPNELLEVDICTSDFKSRDSIVYLAEERYHDNPALTGSTLALIQTLSYLAYAEGLTSTQGSQSYFTAVLQSNVVHRTGVLGFSSGVISACVVAASLSIPSFISNAVEAYRLALWIGIRSQIHRIHLLRSSSLGHINEEGSWSLMLGGLKENDVLHCIRSFNEPFGLDHITVTTVISDERVTVSGNPYHLTAFAKTLPEAVAVYPINVSALYHRADLDIVRQAVLADVATRNIRFPKLTDLMTPIRSTFNGELVFNNNNQGTSTLVEIIVDMILIQPVKWDILVKKSSESLSTDLIIKFLNIGLGPSLMKCVEFAFSQNLGRCCQITNLSDIVMPSRPNIKQEPVAIIGMAVNMPGAPTVGGLWEILESGRSTLSMIPEERFNLRAYQTDTEPGRTLKASTGNFIDGVGDFDHRFFNISAREARSMDPQQRILLQVGYQALENAGYVPNATLTFDPTTFGCFIGAATNDYVHNLKNDIDIYYSTGTLTAFLSGRLSYCLDLSGPSMAIDTACSSSMVAIHQAVRALMNQDCHAALAGGVNVISSPDMFIGLDKGHFLSPTGQCKSFDALADGYSRSEGCGVFVLKRLADALAENDQILGVIRGIEINQSGTAQSITHPHIPTQEALFRQLLSCSDIKSNSVSVVEAHGTGTQAGDTSELESIRRVLAADRVLDNPLHVTSIKANIGHLEAASGCASLAKVLLMFQHKIIPRQISLKTLNPKIARLDADHIIINTTNVPWSTNGSRSRVALISNFGAAGSNTALLVEEHISDGSPHLPTDAASYVFGLSAKDESSLEVLRSDFIRWLQMPRNRHVPLLDLAYTATARRQIHRYRIAHAATSQNELIKKLANSPIFDAKQSSPMIFVFSGQGSHYRGMAHSLYESCPLFKRHIDECEFILTTSGFPGVLTMIINAEAESPLATNSSDEQQSAIFALEYSLAKVWLSWGVKPIAVMGHSLGEYVALVIAGVISLKDGLLIVAARARVMFKKCAKLATGMVAISLGPEDVLALLNSERRFADLSIACFNSPRECVVSGPLSTLRCFMHYIDDKNKAKITQLRVPYGYHSSAMSVLEDDLLDMSEKLKPNSTRLPFISTVLGRVVMPGDETFPPRDYLAQHCIEPVRFIDAVESYLQSSIFCKSAVYLEIGPHPTVLGLLQSFPALSAATFVGSLRKCQDPSLSLSAALATLYISNCTVNWRSTFRDMGSLACINLPSYPFARRNFWVPFVRDSISEPLSPRRTKYSLLRKWLQFPDNSGVSIFETPLEDLNCYIKGHRVGGIPLCPASVYLEMVYAAIHLSSEYLVQTPENTCIVLRQVFFPNPLTWNNSDEKCDVELSVTVDDSSHAFAVKSRASEAAAEVLHTNGTYDLLSNSDTRQRFASSESSIGHSIENLTNPESGIKPDVFSARTTYEVIFPRVVEYSKDFHTLRSLIISSDGMEATGVMQLGPPCEAGQFVVHPLFLDTLLHIAGFLSNLRGDLNDAYICNQIGAVHVLPQYFTDTTTSFIVYCKISSLAGQNCMIGETYARSTGSSQVLVAHLEGIRFQRLRLSGLKTGLAAISAAAPSLAYPSQLTEDDVVPCSTPSTDAVYQLIAKACEMDPADISLDQHFDQLGIDSLMRLELAYDLSKTFPAFGYNPQELSRCSSVQDLVDMILAPRTGGTAPEHHIYDNYPQTPISSTPSYFSSSTTLVHHGEVASSPVRRILANILDMDEGSIKDDSDLATLGLDSFASIEALHTLKHEYNMEAPRDLFSSSRTVQDVEKQMNKLEPSHLPCISPGWTIPNRLSQNPFKKMCEALCANKSLLLLQNISSTLPPLILVHDGSGLTISYERLSSLNRRVWTISNPRFSTSSPWCSVVEMARSYADLIFDEIEGPMILGGWSFGGVVAFEIARQLKERFIEIEGVILIDSPNPLIHVPLTPSLVDEILSRAENLDAELRKLCKTQFIMNAQLLNEYFPPKAQKDECARLVFLRSREPYVAPSQEDIPSWLSNRTDAEHITTGWNTISHDRLIKTLDIPGHHFEPFNRQNIALVSTRIKEACEILDDTKN